MYDYVWLHNKGKGKGKMGMCAAYAVCFILIWAMYIHEQLSASWTAFLSFSCLISVQIEEKVTGMPLVDSWRTTACVGFCHCCCYCCCCCCFGCNFLNRSFVAEKHKSEGAHQYCVGVAYFLFWKHCLLVFCNTIPVQVQALNPIYNWQSINYSLVFVQISPTSRV